MKKSYRKPLVSTERNLEQTSLACNLTSMPPLGWGGGCGDVNVSEYAKGGTWFDPPECSSAPLTEGCGPYPAGEGTGGTGSGVLLS